MTKPDSLTKCPACNKIGTSSNLRYFNINHDECVLLCSNKSCSYPFGYEDLQYSPIIANSNSAQQTGEFDMEFDLSLFENFEIKFRSDASKISGSSDQENLNLNLCPYEPSPFSLICNNNSSIIKCDEEDALNICSFNTIIENDNLKKLESDAIEDICFSAKFENSAILAKPIIRDVQSASNSDKKTASLNKIQVSRFPKFTLDDCDLKSENDGDLSPDDNSDGINSSPSLDSKPVENLDSNNFLHDTIDEICSQPDNINNKIISDSFIQNVIEK